MGLLGRITARVRRAAFARLISRDAREIRRARLTYLAPERLFRIERGLRGVRRRGIPGDFVEFGVALGGSAILAARLLDGDRRFVGFDVFGTIPPPGSADDADAHARFGVIADGRSTGIGGDTYYGYLDDLLDRVRGSFGRFGLAVDGERIALVPGLFEQTVPGRLPRRVAFAHVDCDWHDPVAFCLAALSRTVSPGGVVVVDDYGDYEGCRRATDAFLAASPDFRLVSASPNAVIVRT